MLISPAELLVANYRAFVGDGAEADFQRVLDLKGVARADARTLLDQFRAPAIAPPSAPAPAPPAATTAPSSSSAPAAAAAPAAPVAAAASASAGSIKRLLSFTSEFL